MRGMLLGILWSLGLPQVRCSVRLVLVLLPVVVIIPPLISLIVSASFVIVVPLALVRIISPTLVGIVLPSMVVAATLIVSLIWAFIKVMSGCDSVVFLLELRTFIIIMTIISTDPTYSLWNQLLALLWWGRLSLLSLLLTQLHLLQ